MPIETTKQQFCLTKVIEKQNDHTILQIINSSLKNEASMLTLDKNDKLPKLLLKYESIISRGPTDIGNCILLTHRIDTGDTIPMWMAPRGIPYFQHNKV